MALRVAAVTIATTCSIFMNEARYSIYGDGKVTDDEARAMYLYTCQVSLLFLIPAAVTSTGPVAAESRHTVSCSAITM